MTQQIYGNGFGSNPAENYQQFFVPNIGLPIARDLVEAAAPARGERVLDVACGTGVVTRLLAERVGASGSVIGLDVNPAMLAVARAETPSPTSIEWHEHDATSLPLADGAFDLVTCGMGLQFMPNKLAVLREMRRVLAPGGRLVLNVPGPVPPVFVVIADALARSIGRDAAAFCHIVFSLHDADELRELATSAGFAEIRVTAAVKALPVPSAAAFLWGYIGATPMAPMVAAVDEARRATLERDVVEGLQPFATDDGLTFEVRMTTLRAS